jgi:hypothetical protein
VASGEPKALHWRARDADREPPEQRMPRMRFTDVERRTLLAGLFTLRHARADDGDDQIRSLVAKLRGDLDEAFFWSDPEPRD